MDFKTIFHLQQATKETCDLLLVPLSSLTSSAFLLSCLFCTFVLMKFYEKYPQLKEKGFLSKVLTDTVFSTMSLEDQQVPKPKVIEIVQSLLAEQELKGPQFFTHQGH